MISFSRAAPAFPAPKLPPCTSLRQVPAAAALVDRNGLVLDANPSFYCVLKNAHAGQDDWLDAFEAGGLEPLLSLIGAIDDGHGAASVRLRRRGCTLPIWCVVSGAGQSALRLVTLHYAPEAAQFYESLINVHELIRQYDCERSTLQMHMAAIVGDARIHAECVQ